MGSSRLCRGHGVNDYAPAIPSEGMGLHASPRKRGGEDFTPILAFTPSRGKEKERGWCGRLEGLPVAASFSGDDAAKAWGGEVSGGYCYALLREHV